MTNRFVATITLIAETAARRGFRVALIGGFALPFVGVSRATGDVDFLAEATGSDALDEALVSAGFDRRRRTENVANYASESLRFAPVDFLFARRPATLAMLQRAKMIVIPGAPRPEVAVVDAEGIIGLKVQAIANNPARRRQDEADILSLLRLHLESLDLTLIRGYFRVFEMEADLERLLDETRGR